MTEFQTTVRRYVDLDVTLVEASGTLGEPVRGTFAEGIDAWLTECPSAVVLDLSRCVVDSIAVLTLLIAASFATASRPAVDVFACGTGLARAAPTGLLTFGQREQALAAAAASRAARPVATMTFSRSSDAPAQARRAVRAACAGWHLASVAPDAELIVSELVTNAVLHAGTGGVFEAILRDDFLHLRVRDGGAGVPRIPRRPPGRPELHGRGVALIDMLSSGWGHLIDDAGPGKVVWATLRIH